MAGTLNTNGLTIFGSAAFFESYDLIRYSETQPLARVSLVVTSTSSLFSLNLSQELNFASASVVVAAATNLISFSFNSGAGDDRLTGGGGMDRLNAQAGNDLLNGLAGNDLLRGGIGNDTLNGGPGIDQMVGGLGANVLRGGPGNDRYQLSGESDLVVEYAGGGTDMISSPQDIVLPTNFENATIWGDAFGCYGNSANNILYGNNATNLIEGFGGNDRLSGLPRGADTLDGGAGDDTITTHWGEVEYRGGTGVDTLEFLSEGDDREYDGGVVTLSGLAAGVATGFEIFDFTNSDDDTFRGVETYAVTVYGGYGDDDIRTGSGNDVIYAQEGSDTLNGGAGNDTLSGAAGADTFVFDTPLNAMSNVDSVSFSSGEDEVHLDNAVFRALVPGALRAADFLVGEAATNAAQNVIYNGATGDLFYDADGIGGAAQVQFATLNDAPTLTASDFLII